MGWCVKKGNCVAMYHCCDNSPEIPENAEISGFSATQKRNCNLGINFQRDAG